MLIYLLLLKAPLQSAVTPRPGSADSRGLRPHAPTLKEHARLNSPVGTKRVVARTANVCTVRGLLCDGSASSVSFHFSESFKFPDRQVRPRRWSTPKSRFGSEWGPERRTLDPKCYPNAFPGAPEMCLGALLGIPFDPIAGPYDPGNVSRARTPYFPFVKAPLSPAAAWRL